MTRLPPFWAVVPAAGIGSRMSSNTPKQYLKIGELTVLEHTLSKLAAVDAIKGIVVAIAEHDTYFKDLKHIPGNVTTTIGGVERAHSVLCGLNHLITEGKGQDWALVHDAARPCVQPAKITELLAEVVRHNNGGLLAQQARDTIKLSAKQGLVDQTLDRSKLWQAHTPQAFPIKLLQGAIQHCLTHSLQVTDEASAMEHIGHHPVIVEDNSANIKITEPIDLIIAQALLNIN